MLRILQTKIKYLFSAIMLVMIGFWVNPTKANATTYSTASWARPGTEFALINGNYKLSCSVGFPAMDAAGNRFFITAAHCFRDSHGVPFPDGDETQVWDSSLRFNVGYLAANMKIPPSGPAYDGALVRLYSDASLGGYGWNHIPNSPHNAVLNQKACYVGYRIKSSLCGDITIIDRSDTTPGYYYPKEVDTMLACSYHGNSGGAVFDSSGALGIVTSASDDCSIYSSMNFTPIIPLLNAFSEIYPGLHLV